MEWFEISDISRQVFFLLDYSDSLAFSAMTKDVYEALRERDSDTIWSAKYKIEFCGAVSDRGARRRYISDVNLVRIYTKDANKDRSTDLVKIASTRNWIGLVAWILRSYPNSLSIQNAILTSAFARNDINLLRKVAEQNLPIPDCWFLTAARQGSIVMMEVIICHIDDKYEAIKETYEFAVHDRNSHVIRWLLEWWMNQGHQIGREWGERILRKCGPAVYATVADLFV